MLFCSSIAFLLVLVFHIVEPISMSRELYFGSVVPIGALYALSLWKQLNNPSALSLHLSLISRVLKWRMGKGSKIGCKMASHQLFKDKAKNRVDDLHGMFTDPQFARKESRSIDVAVLEEQVHQMLHEWKVELNEASPASSLLYLGRGIIVLPLPICLRIYAVCCSFVRRKMMLQVRWPRRRILDFDLHRASMLPWLCIKCKTENELSTLILMSSDTELRDRHCGVGGSMEGQ
ncbi:hypothetical protein MRB53_010363 [Persea americana]|uniref:Uncharacterized protein n=1 Tax=Persea americana TaxID=3435 RepID=A0ACC2LSS8_PERAE|nr:hypothetical protein MRB53_010363 [Persea americana]